MIEEEEIKLSWQVWMSVWEEMINIPFVQFSQCNVPSDVIIDFGSSKCKGNAGLCYTEQYRNRLMYNKLAKGDCGLLRRLRRDSHTQVG